MIQNQFPKIRSATFPGRWQCSRGAARIKRMVVKGCMLSYASACNIDVGRLQVTMQDQVLVRAGDSGSHLESAVSGHESSGESCCRMSAIRL